MGCGGMLGEKIKNMFVQKEPAPIYFLSGVEDYLTESAKKYKRNLLYSSGIIVVLTIMKCFGDIDSFDSFLGFRTKESVPIEFIISIVVVVCIYELFMLSIYRRVCDCHWFGKAFQNNKDKSKSDIQYFKEVIEKVSYDFCDLSINKESLKVNLDSVTVGLSIWDDTVKEFISSYCSQIYKFENEVKQGCAKLDSNIDEELKLKLLKQISDQSEIYFKSLSNNLTLKVDNTISNLGKCNEEHNGYVIGKIEEHNGHVIGKIEENINAYRDLSRLLQNVSKPDKLIIILEIYLPLIFGVAAIIVGICQIFSFWKLLI
ncbi:hypothetical protein C9I87_08625 [Photobacterium iliopiscarium]|uniref:hypothetical protein n=1 Tax=Photobacterium iliopiscarium TaxID=56192 RepID=UPI000D17A8D7|nr:hypothetical protein [Photobacterium iliopiscarium]PST95705.1 hypothetical protein C9I87_08625 [Photobacterium iliopiscarium]